MVTRSHALFGIRLVGLLAMLTLFPWGWNEIHEFVSAVYGYYYPDLNYIRDLFRDFWDEFLKSIVYLFCVYLMVDGRLVLPLLMRGLTREPEHRCPACGFDLDGTTSPGCPECGWGLRTRPEKEDRRDA